MTKSQALRNAFYNNIQQQHAFNIFQEMQLCTLCMCIIHIMLVDWTVQNRLSKEGPPGRKPDLFDNVNLQESYIIVINFVTSP